MSESFIQIYLKSSEMFYLDIFLFLYISFSYDVFLKLSLKDEFIFFFLQIIFSLFCENFLNFAKFIFLKYAFCFAIHYLQNKNKFSLVCLLKEQ